MGLQFDGSTQHGSTTAAVDWSASQKISCSMWVWWNDFTSNHVPFQGQANGELVNGQISLWTLEPNSGKPSWLVGASAYGYAGFTAPTAGAWHHLLATFDCSASPVHHSLWIDGVQVFNSVAMTSGPGAATGIGSSNFRNFACYNGSSNLLPGRLTQLAFWPGSLLTGSDATLIYNGGTADWTKVASASAGAPGNGWSLADATGAATYGATGITWTGSPSLVADPSVPAGPLPVVVPASTYAHVCRW